MSEGTGRPVTGARHVTFGPVEIDVGEVGDARIKRMVYPPGMRWSTDLQPLVGTARCEHAHAGFLIEGALHFEFEDGCVLRFAAPAIVEVAPGHDAWVVGEEPAVLIEVDFETTTIPRLGLREAHVHE
jgi:hypothetical protein